MNVHEAAEYLNQAYPDRFKKKLTYLEIKRWLEKRHIKALTETFLDQAVQENRIPPKRGRPVHFSECDKNDIIAACKIMPQGQVAKKFGCDPSYVSLVIRGLR